MAALEIDTKLPYLELRVAGSNTRHFRWLVVAKTSTLYKMSPEDKNFSDL
jgi:hypothetical protein